MITILIGNLQLIGALMVFVFLSFLANTVLGVVKSTAITDSFDKKILAKGLVKGVLILVAVFSLTIVISLFFPVLNYFHIMILEENLMQSINILTLVTPIVTATTVYLKDACSKFKELFSKNNKEVELKLNKYVD